MGRSTEQSKTIQSSGPLKTDPPLMKKSSDHISELILLTSPIPIFLSDYSHPPHVTNAILITYLFSTSPRFPSSKIFANSSLFPPQSSLLFVRIPKQSQVPSTTYDPSTSSAYYNFHPLPLHLTPT